MSIVVYKKHLWSDSLSTDYHRLLNIKDILIITDFLGTEIHGFFKDTAWPRIVLSTALRGYGLLAQVRGLVCFSAVMSRVYTLYSLKANQAIHVAQPSRVFF